VEVAVNEEKTQPPAGWWWLAMGASVVAVGVGCVVVIPLAAWQWIRERLGLRDEPEGPIRVFSPTDFRSMDEPRDT
jgi:hypothetical protein